LRRTEAGGVDPAPLASRRCAPDGDLAAGYVWRNVGGLGLCGDWLNGGQEVEARG